MITNHVANVWVVHGGPRGSVASDGPGKQDDGVGLKAKSMYCILHHCINSILLLARQWCTLNIQTHIQAHIHIQTHTGTYTHTDTYRHTYIYRHTVGGGAV